MCQPSSWTRGPSSRHRINCVASAVPSRDRVTLVTLPSPQRPLSIWWRWRHSWPPMQREHVMSHTQPGCASSPQPLPRRFPAGLLCNSSACTYAQDYSTSNADIWVSSKLMTTLAISLTVLRASTVLLPHSASSTAASTRAAIIGILK